MPAPAGGTGRLVLVDGHSLLHRAFYALPPLSNEQGQPTNAIHGFLSMLLKLVGQEKPRYLAVAMDLPGPTFRHRRFDDYKAHRPDTPDDLRSQVPVLREILGAMGLAMYEAEGFEADDVIGTMAREARQQGVAALIVTGDRDALQLVGEGVDALIMRRGISDFAYFDINEIRKVYGVEPELLVDVKALMGDASDNIPGVPGVGEKTALSLVRSLGTVETILDSLDQVSGKKLPMILKQHQQQAVLSKELAAICLHVPLELDLDRCVLALPEQAEVRDVFLKYGLRSLLERLPSGATEEQVRIDMGQAVPEVRVAGTADDLEASIELIARAQRDDLPLGIWAQVDDDGAVGVGLSAGHAETWWWPSRISGHGCLDPSEVMRAVAGALSRVPHAAGFDIKPLVVAMARARALEASQISLLVPGRLEFDSAIAAYLLDPSRLRYSLSGLARYHLDMDVPGAEELFGRGRAARSPAQLPSNDVAAFFGLRARAAARLAGALAPQLAARGLDPLFDEVEMPLVPVLARMELEGVLVDAAALADMSGDMESRATALEHDIFELAGREFNLNSPQQLSAVLFEDLGLKPVKRTKTGFSTDAEVLEELAAQHAVPARILEYRQLTKLLGTYVHGLAAQLSPGTGRIHTTFNQTVTATGRLSTTEPNLQNIPVREEAGRQLRRAFIAPAGRLLLAADYSQIELRLLAHLSGDERLIQAFLDGADIHTSTAAEVFGAQEVTRTMRDAAKAVNFGIIYGMSDYGLARALKISRGEAADYITRYFDRYPRVRRYLRQSVETARQRGFASTLYGRIRQLPDLSSRNWQRRSLAERMAMNTPIQGTAADVIKMAMVRVQDRLDSSGNDARLLLQVHDELILEVDEGQVDQVQEMVTGIMETVADLAVPLRVDAGYGRSWYEVKGG